MRYKTTASITANVLVLAVASLLFAVTASAQNNQSKMPPRIVRPHANLSLPAQKSSDVRSALDTCVQTWVVPGANNDYMEFCVTANGNIISFQSPNGIEYLDLGTLSEGYGLCDLETGATYDDYADYYESGTFGTATDSGGAPGTYTIVRKTTDGAFTLTQHITKVIGTTPYAKITMALKNNTTVDKYVYLNRWADVDPYDANVSGSFLESFDSTFNAAWGYEPLNYSGPDYAGYGLMVENLGVPTGAFGYGWDGYDLYSNAPPPYWGGDCDPTADYAGYEASVDGSTLMLYYLEIAPKATATVNLRYLAF